MTEVGLGSPALWSHRPASAENQERAEQRYHYTPGDSVGGQPAVPLRGPAEQREGPDHRHRVEKALDRENRGPLRGGDGHVHAPRDHRLERASKELGHDQSQQRNQDRSSTHEQARTRDSPGRGHRPEAEGAKTRQPPGQPSPDRGREQSRAKHETDLRWRQPAFGQHRLGIEMDERGDGPERRGKDDQNQKLPVTADDAQRLGDGPTHPLPRWWTLRLPETGGQERRAQRRTSGQSEWQGVVALRERSPDRRGRRDSDIGHRVESAQEAGEPGAGRLVETVEEKRLL